MSRIALIPLDSRPCCLGFVERLAEIAGLELVTPPGELLGDLQRPGESEALLEWLPEDCPTVLSSLDMLCWGGLVASREPHRSEAAASYRLQRFLDKTQDRRVFAFLSLMRTAPTQTSDLDSQRARLLDELSTWAARTALGVPGAEEVFRRLQADAPAGLVEAYLRIRARNFHLNREAIRCAAHGRLAHLLIGMDDSRSLGWNVFEAHELEREIGRTEAPVSLAPGTDEMAQLQLVRARAAAREIELVWSDRVTPRKPTRYEDRPLGPLVAAQAEAAALDLVPESPRQLWIYGPLGPQAEASEQKPRESRARHFVARLAKALEAGRKVALADVSYANGADVSLARELLVTGVARRLTAYSAWNTAGNTIGTALSALALDPHEPSETSRLAQRLFLAERFADDYLYQAVVRPRLKQVVGPGLRLSPQELSTAEGELSREMLPRLQDLLEQLELAARPQRLALPWSRLFEVEVRLDPG